MNDVILQICLKYLKPRGRAVIIVPKVSSNLGTIQDSKDHHVVLSGYYEDHLCPIADIIPHGNQSLLLTTSHL